METSNNDFEKACLLQKSEDFQEALTIFEKLYENQANNFDLVLHLGECHWKLNNLPAANNYFVKATDLMPESEYASKSAFYTYWTMGKRDEAMAEIKRLYPFAYPDEYKQIVEEINQRPETPD